MIHLNIKYLRMKSLLTQEELAEKINVSRQVIVKWEKGESTPDINSCLAISKLFDVSIDDLVNHNAEEAGVPVAPHGKHFFGKIKMNDDYQITIPKEAIELFKLAPDQELILLGDDVRGMALVPESYINAFLGIYK